MKAGGGDADNKERLSENKRRWLTCVGEPPKAVYKSAMQLDLKLNKIF